MQGEPQSKARSPGNEGRRAVTDWDPVHTGRRRSFFPQRATGKPYVHKTATCEPGGLQAPKAARTYALSLTRKGSSQRPVTPWTCRSHACKGVHAPGCLCPRRVNFPWETLQVNTSVSRLPPSPERCAPMHAWTENAPPRAPCVCL